jgi:hypothetical protein
LSNAALALLFVVKAQDFSFRVTEADRQPAVS